MSKYYVLNPLWHIINRASDIYRVILLIFIINTFLYLAELMSEFQH